MGAGVGSAVPASATSAAQAMWSTTGCSSTCRRRGRSWIWRRRLRHVRFDVHAVYLGHPSGSQDCPATVRGRSEAVVVEPLDGTTSSATADPPGPAWRRRGPRRMCRRRRRCPGGLRFAVPAAGAVVTATFGSATAKAGVETILRSAQLTGSAKATKPAGAATTAVAPAPAPPGPSPGPGLGPPARHLRRPRLRPLRRTELRRRGRLGQLALPRHRRLHRRQRPRLRPAEPHRRMGQHGHRRRLAPDPDSTSAPGPPACQRLHHISVRTGDRPSQGARSATTRRRTSGLRPGPARCSPSTTTWRPTKRARLLQHAASSNFISGWTAELHVRGYLSGVYSSAGSSASPTSPPIGRGAYTLPDHIWTSPLERCPTPTREPVRPGSAWLDHQRIHQYSGGHNETYGGVTINIDGDYLDVASGGAPPPPPPPPSVYWVNTFANAPGYANPYSSSQTGTLNAGTNYVYCKVGGRRIGNARPTTTGGSEPTRTSGPPPSTSRPTTCPGGATTRPRTTTATHSATALRQTPPPSPGQGRLWVDTFAQASVYAPRRALPRPAR